MAQAVDSDRYYMENKTRGKCVIFNHTFFDDEDLEERSGSDKDVAAICDTFGNLLSFSIEVYDDLKYEDVMRKITNLSKENYIDHDCICIFVLSHGQYGEDDLLWARDTLYKANRLWSPFSADKCISLAGKPKLFFFQACRGKKVDSGVQMGKTKLDSSSACYKIPTQADFLIAHSTTKGYYSWRDPAEGTWYIQSLCSILRERFRDDEINKILSRTARKVSKDYISNHDQQHLDKKKQVPSVTSTLLKDLYFF